MNFKLGVLFTLLTLAFAGYIFYAGIMMPDTLGYTEMLIFCGLLAGVSWFVTMGAFEDIDNERKATK